MVEVLTQRSRTMVAGIRRSLAAGLFGLAGFLLMDHKIPFLLIKAANFIGGEAREPITRVIDRYDR